jgi:dienelactone hydrolase
MAIASLGAVALRAPTLRRNPGGGQPPAGRGTNRHRIGRLRDREILADVDATLGHLRQLADARPTELAVLGFCMGGRVTYMLAGARPAAFRAAGVFYGGNIVPPRQR